MAKRTAKMTQPRGDVGVRGRSTQSVLRRLDRGVAWPGRTGQRGLCTGQHGVRVGMARPGVCIWLGR
jgi:hypothetical protein